MIEFGNQYAELFLSSLALGDVDIDANHALGVTVAAIRHETARFDPSNFAIGSNNAILHTVLALPLQERLSSGGIRPVTVLRMRPEPPLAACGLFGTFGQTVQSGIALVDLHVVRIDVIGMAADQSANWALRSASATSAFFRSRMSTVMLMTPAMAPFSSYKGVG